MASFYCVMIIMVFLTASAHSKKKKRFDCWSLLKSIDWTLIEPTIKDAVEEVGKYVGERIGHKENGKIVGRVVGNLIIGTVKTQKRKLQKRNRNKKSKKAKTEL